MYKYLVPHLVFPLFDRLTGRRVWAEIRRLRELQWRSQEELEARALKRLRQVVGHAVMNVPHYRERFGQAGLGAADLRTRADLARFPITTRADLQSGFPDRVVAANLPAERRIPRRTSGSSGTPTQLFSDRAELDQYHAAFAFFYQDWAAAPLWFTRIRIAGEASWAPAQNGLPPGSAWLRPLMTGERVITLRGTRLRLADFQAVVERLRGRPYYLSSHASYAAEIATELLASGRELADYPRVVICSSEVLTSVSAAVIAQGLRCPVVNHYSAWELPHLAQSCPDNPAVLHVNSERGLLRVVRADGTDADPGEPGRVVLTHLRNYVMPLINYELGDWAATEPACCCGRGFPAISGLQGRLGESIRTPDGRRISPTALCNLLTVVYPVHGFVAEFQAVQPARDLLVLRVVPTARYDADFASGLQRQLAELMGADAQVKIELVERVEHEPSGKRLLIKSDLGTRDDAIT